MALYHDTSGGSKEEFSMAHLRPLDPSFPLERQLAVAAAPVVLVNIFSADMNDVDALREAWATDANWMKNRPGFISAQLHRAIGESSFFMNYAVWESVDHFRQAFTHPQFRSHIAHYPSSAVASPQLFEKVAVPNICVA
jgi:heme-degrading monooxygenase HmoA